jgi:hypothetical protein
MLQAIAKLILKIGGWEMVGELPAAKRAVVIAAPHTSNWDGFWALVYKVAIQLDIHFFAKESLFWFPLNILLRALGGVPLDRKRAGSAVDQAIEMFRTEESFYFGLAPEGTRSHADHWKSGFYRIFLPGVLQGHRGPLAGEGRARDVSCGPDHRKEPQEETHSIRGQWGYKGTVTLIRELGSLSPNLPEYRSRAEARSYRSRAIP